MLSVEKPGSPSEILEHHGTKGMKWGVRNNPVNRSFNRKNPTSGHKSDAIRLARSKTNVRYTQATKSKSGSAADRKAAKLAYKRDPNRAIALRTTRGEKVVLSLLALTGIGTLPIAAVTTGMVVQRQHIEKKQARGGYK